MAEGVMRGIVPILLTPFDDDGRIDEESLRSEVEFTLEAGVHGLGLALGSEFLKMSEDERRRVTRVVVEQVRGRVPVVVNTGAQSNVVAALYSRQAEELGASAVMCMPPSTGVSGTEMRSYFKAISDAVRVPVWIQDTTGAQDTFERELLPILRVSSTGLRMGHAVNKEILKRRGVVKSAHVRAPSDPLDALAERELSETLERLGIA